MQPYQLRGRAVSGNLHSCFPEVTLPVLDLNKAQGSLSPAHKQKYQIPPDFPFAMTYSQGFSKRPQAGQPPGPEDLRALREAGLRWGQGNARGCRDAARDAWDCQGFSGLQGC